MLTLGKSSFGSMLLALSLATASCGGSDGAAGDAGRTGALEEAGVKGGEQVGIVLANDSILYGLAVTIQRPDGTTVPGIFRGPTRLLEVATNGTYRFHEDSLPSRVRVLGEGESLRRRAR